MFCRTKISGLEQALRWRIFAPKKDEAKVGRRELDCRLLLRYETKNYEMGGECSMNEIYEKFINDFVGKPEQKT